MAYLTGSELKNLGFLSLGENVKISEKASIYDPELIEIGDYSRIDDFCVISGKLKIGKFTHITPMCLLAGGDYGIEMSDFVTFAYGVKVFSQTDDYSGESLTNSTIPNKYKKEIKLKNIIQSHVIIGANSVIMPGVKLKEGTAIGSMSLVKESTEAWTIYVGSPARVLRKRKKKIKKLEKEFIKEFFR